MSCYVSVKNYIAIVVRKTKLWHVVPECWMTGIRKWVERWQTRKLKF